VAPKLGEIPQLMTTCILAIREHETDEGGSERDSGTRETKDVPSALVEPVSVRYSPYHRQLFPRRSSYTHSLTLLLIQVIRCTREKESYQPTVRWRQGRGKRCIPHRRLRIQVCTRNRTQRSTHCRTPNNRRLKSMPSSACKREGKTCSGDPRKRPSGKR